MPCVVEVRVPTSTPSLLLFTPPLSSLLPVSPVVEPHSSTDLIADHSTSSPLPPRPRRCGVAVARTSLRRPSVCSLFSPSPSLSRRHRHQRLHSEHAFPAQPGRRQGDQHDPHPCPRVRPSLSPLRPSPVSLSLVSRPKPTRSRRMWAASTSATDSRPLSPFAARSTRYNPPHPSAAATDEMASVADPPPHFPSPLSALRSPLSALVSVRPVIPQPFPSSPLE